MGIPRHVAIIISASPLGMREASGPVPSTRGLGRRV